MNPFLSRGCADPLIYNDETDTDTDTPDLSSATHNVLLYTPGTTSPVAIEDNEAFRERINPDMEFFLTARVVHRRVIDGVDIYNDLMMTFFNREVEVWDRPSNPRLEKNVTENTLDSTYSNTRFLGTLDGECSRTADAQPCSSLSSTASVGREVFCHLVVSHGFSPSSLPADLRARLISEDAFKNFRSIGFTLKPVDRSSTYKTLEEHICQGNPQGRFGTLPVSPNMDYTIAADWSYRSPRAIQQFEVSWDIDSPRTEVLSIYDVSSSKDALRDIVSQYPSTVTGGMTIDALVGDIQGFRPWREQVEI